MKFETLSYRKLGGSALFQDFVEEGDELRAFFNDASPFNASSFLKFQKGDFGKVPRGKLVDFLLAFNQQFNATPETAHAIHSLLDEDVFTIVTGQQLCYFGGPAYTFYKTLTLIALAKYLKTESGLKVVPVFWLADEDHDYEEINHVWLPDFSNEAVLQKTALTENARKGHAAGRLFVEESAEEAFGKIQEAAVKGSFYAQKLEELHESWKAGQPWLKAFGELMVRVFGKYGLVLAGSNHPSVKTLCRPVFEQVLCHQASLTVTLSETSRKLADAWHAQVTVTDSLLFWQHPEKGRVKMGFGKEGWQIPGESSPRHFSVEKAQETDDAFFAHLSPSAFLRPVLQQYLLPNLAYCGGAAEVAYHAQMKPFFREFGLDIPLVLPRFSATIADPGIQKTMDHLPFNFLRYKDREEQLLKELAMDQLKQHAQGSISEALGSWKSDTVALFEKHFGTYTTPGSSLETSLKSSIRRIEKIGEQFAGKVIAAQKRKESGSQSRIRKVQNALFPQGIPQERLLGWVSLVALHGDDFADNILHYLSTDTLEKIRFHHIIYL